MDAFRRGGAIVFIPTRIDSSARTDPGQVRENNEDCVGAFEPDDPAVRELRGALYVVADGMGGHQAGEVASQYAVGAVLHDFYDLPWQGAKATLQAAIQEANAAINAEGSMAGEHHGMGTTVVAVAVAGAQAIVAHVGDSRAYLVRDGAALRLTRDHSWVEEKLADGTITPEEAIDHPNRNVLTRNLGQRPHVQCDLTVVDLRMGDRLLVCTDGLWSVLSDAQIAALTQRGTADEAADALVMAANTQGGPDNIGVAVIGYGHTTRGATRRVSGSGLTPAPGPFRFGAAGEVGGNRRGLNPLFIPLGLFVLALAAGVLVAIAYKNSSGSNPKHVPKPLAAASVTAPAAAVASAPAVASPAANVAAAASSTATAAAVATAASPNPAAPSVFGGRTPPPSLSAARQLPAVYKTRAGNAEDFLGSFVPRCYGTGTGEADVSALLTVMKLFNPGVDLSDTSSIPSVPLWMPGDYKTGVQNCPVPASQWTGDLPSDPPPQLAPAAPARAATIPPQPTRSATTPPQSPQGNAGTSNDGGGR